MPGAVRVLNTKVSSTPSKLASTPVYSVTVTPLMPASPASCLPSALRSSQTKLPMLARWGSTLTR